jgi:hypothetical protein
MQHDFIIWCATCGATLSHMPQLYSDDYVESWPPQGWVFVEARKRPHKYIYTCPACLLNKNKPGIVR